MPEPPEPSIYQLRAVLLGISPIIWRCLIVRGDSTIADLHATLQTAFGWSDDHLHRFLIHGKLYGVAYLDGITFRDDPRRFWCNFLRTGRLSLFQLLLMRQSPLPIPAGS